MSVADNVLRATAFHALASCYPELHRIHGPQPEQEILLKASEEITTFRADANKMQHLACIVRDMWEHYEAMHEHTTGPTWDGFLAFTRDLESIVGGPAVDAAAKRPDPNPY